jgi:hypothetical protein
VFEVQALLDFVENSKPSDVAEIPRTLRNPVRDFKELRVNEHLPS